MDQAVRASLSGLCRTQRPGFELRSGRIRKKLVVSLQIISFCISWLPNSVEYFAASTTDHGDEQSKIDKVSHLLKILIK